MTSKFHTITYRNFTAKFPKAQFTIESATKLMKRFVHDRQIRNMDK